MEERGRPTDLTEELFAKIKECVLEGMTLRDLAKHCEIPESTLYTWTYKNYLNIADKIEGWRRDRKLKLADITSDLIQTLPAVDDSGKLDKELLKIKQKEAEFIRETLGKVYYSKRTEQTGPEGGAVQIQIVNYDNTPTQVSTETIPTEISSGLGFGSETSSEGSSPSEWEGFSSDGEPTKENA